MGSYIITLESIMKDLHKKNQVKLDELEELYQYKPVRAEWYLAKAKILFDNGENVDTCFQLLERKTEQNDVSDIVAEIQKFCVELDIAADAAFMVDSRFFQIAWIKGNRNEVNRRIHKLFTYENLFLENSIDILQLSRQYLTCDMLFNYFILKLYDIYMNQNLIPSWDWLQNIPNFGFVKESIEKKKPVIIIIDSKDYQNNAFVLGYCIAQMGCPVYALNVPEQVEVDGMLLLEDTVSVSMENIVEVYGMQVIPSIEVIADGKSLGTNEEYIINSLCNKSNFWILARRKKFEELSKNNLLKNRVGNLYNYKEMLYGDHYAFGWAGSYLNYITQIYYNIDVEKALYRKPDCRFSIVIPARNSADTLQHTLKTCLNQRWKRDYEIVISDNSTDGNQEVYQFCQTLQDDRIKYYKTPRDLRLNHSFEYAFLQTRGEYVFSIGSDDALLPWTLEVWDQVISDYPEEEIFLWDRGFYAWPGFNGGQQHQFVIPGKYGKGDYNTEYVEPIQFLSWAMERPDAMYLLPMLYINSGFKRSFMQTLLKDTGRLWDGICQDIYMGVIVSAIKEKVVKINYPLTVAGMSTGSAGAVSTLPVTDQAKDRKTVGRELKENNVGGFCRSQVETLMPELGSDVTSLYNSILRAVNRGLIPGHYLVDAFDWKTWFMNSYRIMRKEDIYFDRKIHQMRFAAMKHGDEFLEWFDETIYKDAMIPVIFVENTNTDRTYQEKEGDIIVLDASKRDVHNVYEASLLFEKLSGL